MEKFVENTVCTEEGQFRRLIFGVKSADDSIIPVKGWNLKGEVSTFIYEKLINGKWIEIDRPECFIPEVLKTEDLIKKVNPKCFKILGIGRKLKKCC